MRRIAIEAVAIQLQNKEPSEVAQSINELMRSGYNWLSAVEILSAVLLEEMYYVLKYKNGYNHERYCRKLRQSGLNIPDLDL